VAAGAGLHGVEIVPFGAQMAIVVASGDAEDAEGACVVVTSILATTTRHNVKQRVVDADALLTAIDASFSREPLLSTGDIHCSST
jgi:hypothetical protein